MTKAWFSARPATCQRSPDLCQWPSRHIRGREKETSVAAPGSKKTTNGQGLVRDAPSLGPTRDRVRDNYVSNAGLGYADCSRYGISPAEGSAGAELVSWVI